MIMVQWYFSNVHFSSQLFDLFSESVSIAKKIKNNPPQASTYVYYDLAIHIMIFQHLFLLAVSQNLHRNKWMELLSTTDIGDPINYKRQHQKK